MAALQDVLGQLQSLSAEDRKKVVAQLDLSDRIVVESPSVPKPRKLRLFSGKKPVPSSEVDFDTWKLLVDQLLEDTTVPEADKKRVIVQNLLRPALDAVKAIQGSGQDIVEVLSNIYGSVADGHELLIKFQTSYQGEKETASDYLQRIYILLIDTTEKGGADLANVSKLLLEQFIRGSIDDNLILKLKLEEKLENPPTFANLLLSVRKEESKAVEKRLRLKVGRVSSVIEDQSSISSLQTRVSQLEAQLKQQQSVQKSKVVSSPVSDDACSKSEATSNSDTKTHKGKFRKFRSRSDRTLFCYRCGEDGHSIAKCEGQKNPTLVQQKLESRWNNDRPAADPNA